MDDDMKDRVRRAWDDLHRRLSQAAAAARLFIAPSTLGCYEAGHKAVPAFRYDSLAAALGMPANWYRVKP